MSDATDLVGDRHVDETLDRLRSALDDARSAATTARARHLPPPMTGDDGVAVSGSRPACARSVLFLVRTRKVLPRSAGGGNRAHGAEQT
jgi:hypothetical protein